MLGLQQLFERRLDASNHPEVNFIVSSLSLAAEAARAADGVSMRLDFPCCSVRASMLLWEQEQLSMTWMRSWVSIRKRSLQGPVSDTVEIANFGSRSLKSWVRGFVLWGCKCLCTSSQFSKHSSFSFCSHCCPAARKLVWHLGHR